MPAQAVPKFIAQKWQYRIRIQDQTIGHFESCSSIESEVEMTEYHQGGSRDAAIKTPGKRKVAAVTLSAGASDNEDLWNMWEAIGDAQGAGKSLDEQRKQITIDMLAEDCETVRKSWVLNQAMMSKFVAGEFDAKSSDNVIEAATFEYIRLGKP